MAIYLKNNKYQCPVSGLFHFYYQKMPHIQVKHWMCQCPVSGLFHFYRGTLLQCSRNILVSMPCVGLIPFLRDLIKIENGTVRVSMPCVGLIPFLRKNVFEPISVEVGVNALCRAYSISTKSLNAYSNYAQLCQCPVSGLFHFYTSMLLIPIKNYWVSMPCVGLIPFLPQQVVVSFEVPEGVNALCRAYSISTRRHRSVN